MSDLLSFAGDLVPFNQGGTFFFIDYNLRHNTFFFFFFFFTVAVKYSTIPCLQRTLAQSTKKMEMAQKNRHFCFPAGLNLDFLET